MFHLVLMCVATLAGMAIGFPYRGFSDVALESDWVTADPFDEYYGRWSGNYKNGLISDGLAGVRASWPFDRQGAVLSSDISGHFFPTVLPSNSVIRPYPWYSRGYDSVTDAVSVVTGPSSYHFTDPPSYRADYYNNLRFGGLRGGWGDYIWAADRFDRPPSTLGYGTTRSSSVRMGGDKMYLKK